MFLVSLAVVASVAAGPTMQLYEKSPDKTYKRGKAAGRGVAGGGGKGRGTLTYRKGGTRGTQWERINLIIAGEEELYELVRKGV